MKHRLWIFVLGALVAFQSHSFAGTVAGFGGSTEFTQILNNFQLGGIQIKEMIQVHNQLRQLNDMIKNGVPITDQMWNGAHSDLVRLAQLVQQGQALAYSAANIDQEFQKKFEEYGQYLSDELGVTSFKDKYNEWSRTNLGSIQSALQTTQVQSRELQTEQQTLSLLERKSSSASGRMQAIQVGNQIAAQQVRQQQKLRTLMMTQMQMQGAYMATQTEERTLLKAQNARLNQPNQTILGNERRY